MKRFTKATAIILAIILTLALLVPMALKGKIGEIVKTEANKLLTATLDFEELDIRLLRHFPNASLELKELTLVSGVEPFIGETVVAAERISVVVNLLSLFTDEGFEVRRILLDNPQIYGHIAETGAANWEVMKPSESPQEEENPTEEENAESASTFRLALKDFQISEATLRYDNDSTKTYASITPLNLRLKGDFSASESLLKLKTTASQIYFESEGMKLVNGVEAEIQADIATNLEEKIFTLNKNKFRLNAIEMTLDGNVAMLEEGMDIDLKLQSNEIHFRELLSLIPAFYTRDFESLKATGELTLSAWANGRWIGEQLPAFDLQLGVRDGSFKYAMLPKSVTNIRLDAQVNNPGGTLDATRVQLSDFGVTLGGNTLTASFSAATPISDLQFTATMAGRMDLGAIKEVYPLGDSISLAGLVALDVKAAGRMSDISAQRFEQIAAEGTLTLEQMEAHLTSLPPMEIERMTATLSPRALTLGECQIKVGNSDLKGNGQVSNYLGWFLRDEVLGGRLYLQSNLLDLNELMGIAGGEESPEEPEKNPEQIDEKSDTATVFEVPKNLDLALQTSVNRILFQKMTLEDFTGHIAIQGGKAELSALKMKALGGALSASGSYSTAENPASPQLALNAHVEKASFARTFQELEMIQKLVPLFEKTGGDYSMAFDLTSRMRADWSIDYPTLNASGEISSSNIQLGNVPIFNKLTSALNVGKIQSSLEGKLVVVKFSIANGRLTTKPFDLKLGSTLIHLSGSTGLDQSIDYTARVELPGKVANTLQHLDVKIGGTFSAPKISVDLAGAAKEAATQLLNEQVERLTGSPNLNTEIEKQAEKLRQEARSAGEKLVAEAEKQREALIAKANNAIAKLAAEKAGDALVKEAQKQADKLVAAAEEKITQLEAKAKGEK